VTHAPASRPKAIRPILLACLLTSHAFAPAQSAAPPAQPSAPLVRLNVIVTDGSGRSVTDVRQEEISLLEDGKPQTIIHFAREELPVSYGLVIDNSASVRPLLDILRKTAGTIASGNREGDETSIVRFVDSDKIEEFQDFTSDPRLLAQALSRLYVEGGPTAVIDATYLAVQKAAARRKDEAGRRRAVVLISDCENRMNHYSREELLKLLRRESVQVFVISFLTGVSDERGFTRPSPRENARKLADEIAEESGGRAFFPKNIGELIKAAEEISRDLRSQYVIGYSPANAKADGKFRKVEVKIADAPGRAKRKAITRPGHFAGK
jgi:Ca-activated chloride channel homolog